MSNIHGLYTNRGKPTGGDHEHDDDEDDDDDSNRLYVGGIGARGGGSGLAVQPPPRDRSDATSASAARDTVFSLAEAADETHHDHEHGAAASSSSLARVRRTITMYRDGFTVDDDGPFRRLDDPANGEFLRALARGQTPPELLVDAANGGNITVGLIDKRHEEYVETFRVFSGAGQTLVATSTNAATPGVIDVATLPLAVAPLASTPPTTTTLQVRLPNGQRRVLTFVPTHHTVRDVATYLVRGGPPPMTPGGESTPPLLDAVVGPTTAAQIQLVAGYPPQPLTDLDATLEQAQLCNAQLAVVVVAPK